MLEMRWNAACQVLYSLIKMRSSKAFLGRKLQNLTFQKRDWFSTNLSYDILFAVKSDRIFWVTGLWSHMLSFFLKAAIPMRKLKLRLYPDCWRLPASIACRSDIGLMCVKHENDSRNTKSQQKLKAEVSFLQNSSCACVKLKVQLRVECLTSSLGKPMSHRLFIANLRSRIKTLIPFDPA